jgi:hypothetical protein
MRQPEVLFEMTQIGPVMKVVAIDAATGEEVAVMGPAYGAAAPLRTLAQAKLKARLLRGENR